MAPRWRRCVALSTMCSAALLCFTALVAPLEANAIATSTDMLPEFDKSSDVVSSGFSESQSGDLSRDRLTLPTSENVIESSATSGDAAVMAARDATLISPGSGTDQVITLSEKTRDVIDAKLPGQVDPNPGSGSFSDVSGQGTDSHVTSTTVMTSHVTLTEVLTSATVRLRRLGENCSRDSDCEGGANTTCRSLSCACAETHFLTNGTCMAKLGPREKCRNDSMCQASLRCKDESKPEKRFCTCEEEMYWSTSRSQCANNSFIKPNITITRQGQGNLSVTWAVDSPQDVKSYRIVCHKFLRNTINAKELKEDNVSSPYLITGLVPGHKYKIRVLAFTVHGEKGRQDEFFVEDPSPPQTLEVDDVTEECVHLGWTAGQGVRQTFLVHVQPLDPATPDVPARTSNETDIDVCELVAGTLYNFSVVSMSRDKNSTAVSIRGMTKPAPPTDLQVTHRNSTCISLGWSKPSGHYDVIRVEAAPNDANASSPTATVIDNTTSSGASVCNLEPGRGYDVTVTSQRGNYSSREEKLSVGTCAATVAGITYREITPGKVLVTWNASTGSVDSYVAELRGVDVNMTTSLTNQKWRINRSLQRGVEYQGSILALANNCSDGRREFTFKLGETIPGPVTFNVTWSASHGLEVTWFPPAKPNGVITGYQLNVTQGRQLITTVDVPDNQTTWEWLATRGQCYTVRVSAANRAGLGVPESTSLRVPEDAPGKVTNLTAEQIDVDVVTIRWEPPTEPNGVISGFELRLTDSRTGSEMFHVFNCTENCIRTCPDDVSGSLSYGGLDTEETSDGDLGYVVNVTEFCPPATLSVSVVALTSAGRGANATTSVHLEEGQPGPPRNFSATAVNATALLLTWQSPRGRGRCNSSVTSYRLTYAEVTSSTAARSPFSSSIPDHRGTQRAYLTSFQPSLSTLPPYLKTSPTYLPWTSLNPFPFSRTSTPMAPRTSPRSPGSTTVLSFSDGAVSSPPPHLGDRVVQIPATGEFQEELLGGLRYWTRYSLVLEPMSPAGEGPGASTSARTDEHVPTSPVRNLKVKVKSSTSLSLTWLPPLEANGVITNYTLELFAEERSCPAPTPSPSILVAQVGTPAENITLEGLHPFWTYEIRVSPWTIVGPGNNASVIVERTSPDVPSSMEGANWTISSLTFDSVTLHWSPVCFINSNASTLEYLLEYEYAETLAFSNRKTTSTAVLNVTLTELEPLARYRIRVTASNSLGKSKPSDWFYFNTTNKAPSSITSVSALATNSTCLIATWSGGEVPRGSKVTYFLHLRDENGGNTSKFPCPGNAGPCVACGLTAYWNYSVTVSATNTGGRVQSTDKSLVTTLEGMPGRVQNVAVNVTRTDDVTAARYVNVTWNAPRPRERRGVITGYGIRLTPSNSQFEDIFQKVVPEVTDTSNYSKLILVRTETFYTLEVRAETKAGAGEPVRVKSQEVPPGALPHPEESEAHPLVVQQAMTTLPDPSRQIAVSLPVSFLCNHTYGRPQLWGVVVQAASTDYRPGRPFRGRREDYFNMRPRKWTEQHGHSDYVVELRDFECFGTERFTVEMGRDANCSLPRSRQCNGRLLPNTHYRFRAFMCTKLGCTETLFSHSIKTAEPKGPPLALVVAIAIIVAVVVVVVLVALVVLWRRRTSASRFPSEKIGMRMMDNSRGQRVTASTGSEFTRSRPIRLSNFAHHVEQMHQQSNLGFSEEFKRLKAASPAHSTKTAELLACKGKNRYQNILPFDRTRVKLLPNDDEEGSDYINANFLMGYNHKREYIAAQGPLPATKDDFWRMVWEQKVKVIVMLTQCVERGKVKCEEYWPECGEPVYFGDLLVQVRSESVLPCYVIRIIDLVCGDSKRTIKHFHFLKWPDFGCPEKTWLLLNFVSAVRSHTPHDAGPIVVHCSAGVGRTGTFVTVDFALQHIREHDEVDILGLVLQMRESRTQMVQSESQYIYIHDCIRDALEEETDEEEEEEMNDDLDEHIYMNSAECNGRRA